MAVFHVNDVGSIIRRTIKDGGVTVNLSTATTKQFRFRRPDGSILVKPAAFTTDGTNGAIEYVTISGDLSLPGVWQGQCYFVLVSGTWATDLFSFEVGANLV